MNHLAKETTDFFEWKAFLERFDVPFSIDKNEDRFAGPTINVENSGLNKNLGGYKDCALEIGFDEHEKFIKMNIWG